MEEEEEEIEGKKLQTKRVSPRYTEWSGREGGGREEGRKEGRKEGREGERGMENVWEREKELTVFMKVWENSC